MSTATQETAMRNALIIAAVLAGFGAPSVTPAIRRGQQVRHCLEQMQYQRRQVPEPGPLHDPVRSEICGVQAIRSPRAPRNRHASADFESKEKGRHFQCRKRRPSRALRSIADALADLYVLTILIGAMDDNGPAVPAIVAVVAPVGTDICAVRTDAELDRVCRRYCSRGQHRERGERQETSLHRHLLAER